MFATRVIRVQEPVQACFPLELEANTFQCLSHSEVCQRGVGMYQTPDALAQAPGLKAAADVAGVWAECIQLGSRD